MFSAGLNAAAYGGSVGGTTSTIVQNRAVTAWSLPSHLSTDTITTSLLGSSTCFFKEDLRQIRLGDLESEKTRKLAPNERSLRVSPNLSFLETM